MMHQLSISRRREQAIGGALERLVILLEQKQHVLQAATFGVLVALLLLTGCASPASPSTSHVGATPPTSAVTVIPTPSPTEPRLGPIPQHCPVSNPTPHMSLPGLGPVIGASPVWADWPRGPVIAHLSPPPGTPNTYEPPYGWAMLKTIWEVGPNYTHPLMVRGYDLYDHTPLLIQFLDNPPTADAVLDPQHPDQPPVRCWRGVG